jgi:hypothetical protein
LPDKALSNRGPEALQYRSLLSITRLALGFPLRQDLVCRSGLSGGYNARTRTRTRTCASTVSGVCGVREWPFGPHRPQSRRDLARTGSLDRCLSPGRPRSRREVVLVHPRRIRRVHRSRNLDGSLAPMPMPAPAPTPPRRASVVRDRNVYLAPSRRSDVECRLDVGWEWSGTGVLRHDPERVDYAYNQANFVSDR